MWNAAGSQQAGSENDGADGVLVGGVTRAHIVVGHGSEIMTRGQPVESDRRSGGALELFAGAVGLDVERLEKMGDAIRDLGLGNLFAQRRQLIHLQEFDVPAEGDRKSTRLNSSH